MGLDFSNVRLFDWGVLYASELEFEMGIDALKILLSKMDEMIQIVEVDFRKDVSRAMEFIDVEYQGDFYSQVFEIEEKTIAEIRRQKMYGIILSIFSHFEGLTKNICQQVEQEFSLKIRRRERGESDLMRYWNYLTKEFAIEAHSIEQNYTQIEQSKIVRNAIAHNSGILRKSERDRIRPVEGLNMHREGDGFRIDPESNYISHLFVMMSEFFKGLVTAVDHRYKLNKGVG